MGAVWSSLRRATHEHKDLTDQSWVKHYYSKHFLSTHLSQPLAPTAAQCHTVFVEGERTKTGSVSDEFEATLSTASSPIRCSICNERDRSLLSLQVWEVAGHDIRNFVLESTIGVNPPLFVGVIHEPTCPYHDVNTNGSNQALMHEGCWTGLLCERCTDRLRRITPALIAHLKDSAEQQTNIDIERITKCIICYEPCDTFVGCCAQCCCLTCVYRSRNLAKCPCCNDTRVYPSWRADALQMLETVEVVIRRVWQKT
jgi:hypothetical protein